MGQQQSLNSGELEKAFEVASKGAGVLQRKQAAALLKKLAIVRGVTVSKSSLSASLKDSNTLEDVKQVACAHWEQTLLSQSLQMQVDIEGESPPATPHVPLAIALEDPRVTHIICGLNDAATYKAFLEFACNFECSTVQHVVRPWQLLGISTLLVCYRRGLDKNISRQILQLVERAYVPEISPVALISGNGGYSISLTSAFPEGHPPKRHKQQLHVWGVDTVGLVFISLERLLKNPPASLRHNLLVFVDAQDDRQAAISAFKSAVEAMGGNSGYLRANVVVSGDAPLNYSELYREFEGSSGFGATLQHCLESMHSEPLMEGRPLNWGEHSSYTFPVSQLARVDLMDSVDLQRAHRFTQMARAEHASIGSFAAFSLSLIACGAPLDLVRGAHLAALDEVSHSRLAFSLASGFSGCLVSPVASLSSHSLSVSPCVSSLALSTAREACINETLACLQAVRQECLEEDPRVSSALRVIISDERRHAALGWRTARWCLQEKASLEEPLRSLFKGSEHRETLEPLVHWLFEGDAESLQEALELVLQQ